MKKILFSLALFFCTSYLFGAYQIKIAVYKDRANLMTYLSKMPEENYRKNIIIEEKNQLNYVTSVLYEDEKEVKKALSAYRKMFSDAFIIEVAKTGAVQGSGEKTAQNPKQPEKAAAAPLNAQKLLGNKTVYLCYEEGSADAKERVIQMDFKKEYVVYSKLKSRNLPIHIPYTFDNDCVILPVSGINFKYQIYREGQDYLSAKSFIADKKGHQIRYYFDKDLALEFAKNHQY